MRFVSPRWQRVSVTTKFSAAFGLFLLLIIFVSAISALTLNEVNRQADETLDNAALQRLVLEIDSGLQKARLLQRDFFLQYPIIGVSDARQRYGLPAVEQISRVIILSQQLKQVASLKNQAGALGASSPTDLNLYLSAAERNADVFFSSVELVGQLAAPDTGLIANLDRTARVMLNLLTNIDDPALTTHYWEMEAFRQRYLATRQRPYFQAAFNAGNDLRQAATGVSTLTPAQHAELLLLLDNYNAFGEQILDLDVQLTSNLHDLDLQAEAVDPITGQLLSYATGEVKTAHSQIIRISRTATQTVIIAAVAAALFALLIAIGLNRSITHNILRLTSAASALRAGNLAVRTHVTSGDELGHLAYTLDSMAAQLQETLDKEREARQEAEIARQQEAYQRSELARSERKYRALFEQSRDAIFIVSRSGEFIALNQAALDLFGYTLDEITQMRVQDLYANSSQHLLFQEAIEKNGAVTDYENRLRTKEGSERICLVTASLVRLEDGSVMGYQGIIRDITERRQAEQALQRYTERLRILHLIDRAILNVERPQASAETALKRLQQIVPFIHGSVSVFEQDQFVILTSLSDVPPLLEPGTRLPSTFIPLDRLQQGSVWEVQDWSLSAEWGQINNQLKAAGVDAIIAVPLLARSELIGMLTLAMKAPDRFSPEHIEIAQDVANQLAIVMQQARLLEAEQRRRRVAETLVHSAEVLNSTLEIDQVLRRILNQMSEVVELDSTSLMRLEGSHLRVIAHRGFTRESELENLIIPLTPDYPNWQVIETRQPLALEDVTCEYPAFITKGYSDSTQRIRSWLGLPMILRDRVIGMIAVDRRDVRPFVEDEIVLGMAFASQAATALENARLYDQVQRHAAELEQHVARRTMELQQANVELQALTRIKDEFVSNVSHELRTPITSLKLRYHLLQKQPDMLDKHLPVIQREIERLAAIIDDLLTLSRMQQGADSFTRVPVDLEHLAREYVQDRVPVAEARGLSLSFESSTDALPSLQADRGLIEQALGIMVSNALNYTHAGGRVTVSVMAGSFDGRPAVGLRVADTGVGITPEDRVRLFEPFVRGKASQETGAQGTGLGLALLKQIVDKHGGAVEVQSTGIPGEGSVFTIWLPAAG